MPSSAERGPRQGTAALSLWAEDGQWDKANPSVDQCMQPSVYSLQLKKKLGTFNCAHITS